MDNIVLQSCFVLCVERRQSTDHLVEHSAQAVEVDLISVALSQNHFWSHVLDRPTKSCVIPELPLNLGQAEVSQLDVSIKVNQDILRFQIPVKDPLRMDVLQSKQDLGKVKPGLVLTEILAAL